MVLKGMIHNFMWRKRRTSFLNDKKIRIANGFHRDYSTIRDFIIDVVNKSNNKDVVVHGHSKGGVLAALCALDIVSNTTDKNVEAFSIGMLRTGNKHFADYFDKKLPNYINIDYGSDFWSQLAPRWLGFHHVGKRIHLGPKRKWGFGRRKDHHWDVYHNALKEHLTDEMLKEDK
jgi:predicted lipase